MELVQGDGDLDNLMGLLIRANARPKRGDLRISVQPGSLNAEDQRGNSSPPPLTLAQQVVHNMATRFGFRSRRKQIILTVVPIGLVLTQLATPLLHQRLSMSYRIQNQSRRPLIQCKHQHEQAVQRQ